MRRAPAGAEAGVRRLPGRGTFFWVEKRPRNGVTSVRFSPLAAGPRRWLPLTLLPGLDPRIRGSLPLPSPGYQPHGRVEPYRRPLVRWFARGRGERVGVRGVLLTQSQKLPI